jgi:hypothetical protein
MRVTMVEEHDERHLVQRSRELTRERISTLEGKGYYWPGVPGDRLPWWHYPHPDLWDWRPGMSYGPMLDGMDHPYVILSRAADPIYASDVYPPWQWVNGRRRQEWDDRDCLRAFVDREEGSLNNPIARLTGKGWRVEVNRDRSIHNPAETVAVWFRPPKRTVEEQIIFLYQAIDRQTPQTGDPDLVAACFDRIQDLVSRERLRRLRSMRNAHKNGLTREDAGRVVRRIVAEGRAFNYDK